MRSHKIIDTLLVLPWWASVLTGVIGYGLIGLVLPLIWTDTLLGAIAQALRPVALLWLFACMVSAGFSALRSFLIARKLDGQRGLEDIRSLSWQQFESIVGEVFRRRGYAVLENAVEGADGGVDLVLRKSGAKYFAQCKQWRVRTVGVKPVRELKGVIVTHGATGGIFVTAGGYTAEARRFAALCGLWLIDGPELVRMVREAQTGETDVRAATPDACRTPKPTMFVETPSCPTCGSAMAARLAKRGANAGGQFWGCSQYPRCRGTRDMAK